MDYFLGNLEIKPFKKSYLVEISFKSRDKHLAQQVAGAIYNEYVKFSMKTRQQSYKLIKDWLENELDQLGKKVDVCRKRNSDEHGHKKDFLSLEGDQNVIVKKYVELSILFAKAQAERAVKEAHFRQIKEKGVDAPLVVNNPLIQKLREETINQEAKVSSLNKIYDRNYPQLQVEQAKLNELRSRLNNELKRMRASVEADYQAAVRVEDLLKESLEAHKGNVIELQHNLVEHHILQREYKTNEELFKALLARMKEASISSTMVAGNVAVITPRSCP